MKILDRGEHGCGMCRRLPVLNEGEKQRLDSGQSLQSLVLEEYSRVQGIEEVEEVKNKDKAINKMNNAMDELESLFGFDTKPKKEEQKDNSKLQSVTAEDANFDGSIYQIDGMTYICTRTKDYSIMYCPFCGEKIWL